MQSFLDAASMLKNKILPDTGAASMLFQSLCKSFDQIFALRMKRIGFPYCISNFETLVRMGKHYVDRTMYLAKREDMDARSYFSLCPRRFGKGLAVSVMEYYNGKQHRAKFKGGLSNGIVRKFFEVVKEGTWSGIIDCIFATGGSPVTLDSLTSGFNVGTDLLLEPSMHDFMVFIETEVSDILRLAEVTEGEFGRVLLCVRVRYNGYLFRPEAREQLYSPVMVWHFAAKYRSPGRYPDAPVSTSVMSDHDKIESMLRIGN